MTKKELEDKFSTCIFCLYYEMGECKGTPAQCLINQLSNKNSINEDAQEVNESF